MRKCSFLLTLCLLVFILDTSSQQQKSESVAKQLLVGEWLFLSWEPEGKITEFEAKQYAEENKKAANMKFTFTSGGAVKCVQPNGVQQNNFSGVYRYYPSRKNLVLEMKDGIMKLEVIMCSKVTLKLKLSDNNPLMVLRRVSKL